MTIEERTDTETIETICKAPKALVYLSVPWSVPERRAREAFRTAVARLVEGRSDLGVAYFILDEEAEVTQDFLITLGLARRRG
jgi:hypothetical protein